MGRFDGKVALVTGATRELEKQLQCVWHLKAHWWRLIIVPLGIPAKHWHKLRLLAAKVLLWKRICATRNK